MKPGFQLSEMNQDAFLLQFYAGGELLRLRIANDPKELSGVATLMQALCCASLTVPEARRAAAVRRGMLVIKKRALRAGDGDPRLRPEYFTGHPFRGKALGDLTRAMVQAVNQV